MKRTFILVTVFIFTIFGCSSAVHRAQVSKQEFKSGYKTVVLTHVGLPDGLRHRHDVRDFYLQHVRSKLISGGFEVVEPDVYYSVFNQFREQVGGYYDTKTGQLIDEKFEQIKRSTLAELRKTHNVDAVLYHDIRVRTAAFGQYRAQWDGQSETYEKNNNDAANFLSSIVQQTKGSLPALSYLLFVEDANAKELYMGAGGIQLISKLNDSDKFEDLPVSQLLKDTNKLAFSASEALRKLVDAEEN